MAQARFGLCFLLTTLLTAGLFIWLSYSVTRTREQPTLIVIAIDAFRHDFIHRPECKSLRSFAKNGIYGAMIPQFPSFTFTNFYSLVTGLYPREHGIVANRFYDNSKKLKFLQADPKIRTQSYWWRAEPIWITANNEGMRTATLFWPSDEIWKHDRNKCLPYDKSLSYPARINQFFQWIDEDPDLSMATLYFSLVDEAAHHYGPDSPEMSRTLSELDRHMGQLLAGLKARNLYNNVNIVIVSDHGQIQATPGESNIYIDSYVPDLASKILWMDYTVVTTIFTLPGMEDEVFQSINDAIKEHNLPMEILWTEDLDKRLHYQPNDRIGPLIIMTEPGYTLAPLSGREWGGFHGYHPKLNEMQSFFLAQGPSIQGLGKVDQPIESLDVYPLLAQLLGVTPLPHNGTQSLVEKLIVPLK